MEKVAKMLGQTVARRLLSVLLITFLLLLVACSGSAPSTPSVSPTATIPSTPTIPAGTVLYQADWSHGLAGWQVTGGWKALHGYLQSDGSNTLSLTPTYRPAVPNYAVEVRVQVVSVVNDGG